MSTSEYNGGGLFVSRVHDEFYIDLLEYSMYGYCYIFPLQVYIIILSYRVYIMQLKVNSNGIIMIT